MAPKQQKSGRWRGNRLQVRDRCDYGWWWIHFQRLVLHYVAPEDVSLGEPIRKRVYLAAKSAIDPRDCRARTAAWQSGFLLFFVIFSVCVCVVARPSISSSTLSGVIWRGSDCVVSVFSVDAVSMIFKSPASLTFTQPINSITLSIFYELHRRTHRSIAL